jgi:membrane protein
MEQRKSVWQFLKSTVIQWLEDRPFQLASSLSYYTIFSLAPLLVIVIAIAGFAFGEAAAEQRIVGTIQGMIGEDSARAVQTMIENASRQPKTGIISAAMGFLALLLGAGGVVGQLQTSLNTIWGVEPKPGQGLRGFLRQRFLSLAMVMGIGFLLLVSLVISAAITGLSRFIGRFVTLAYALDVLVSLLLITSLFAMIYKFLPDVRIHWRDVWIGALLTAVLFTIGKFLIALYLGRSGVSSTFGAAASLITILLWVYYSSLIFFLGAEFTQVYATWYGSGVSPAAHAEPIGATRKRQTPAPEMRSVPERSSANDFPRT